MPMDFKHFAVRKSGVFARRGVTRRGITFRFGRRKRRRTLGPSRQASTALKLVRAINREREVKNVSPPASTDPVPILPLVITDDFTNIGGGALFNERIGNAIGLFKMEVRFTVHVNLAVPSSASVRIIIIRDLQQVGSTRPTIANYLTTVSFEASVDPVFRTRWVTYVDQVVQVTINQPFIDGVFTIRKKVKVKWANAGGTSWTKNGIYMFVLTNASVNQPQFIRSLVTLYNDA